MARPRKYRTVCQYPSTLGFAPLDAPSGCGTITLTVDEYETLRLIDREGLSQEVCGEQMGVARTTVQQIYASARKKLADALVEGLELRIAGGDYRLCGGDARCSVCHKQQFTKPKGEHIMRIAVTYENGQIFQHFGHTEYFKVYDVQEGKIVSAEVISTNGSGHGALAGVLGALNADALICGGIGGGAQMALSAAGIKWYAGVSGDADAAVEALIAGGLDYDPDARCDHHGEHHGEGHDCGSHDCGEHACGHNCHE